MNRQMMNNLGVIRFSNARKSEQEAELQQLRDENEALRRQVASKAENDLDVTAVFKAEKPKPAVTVTKQEKQQAFEQRLLNPCAHNIRMMGFRLT